MTPEVGDNIGAQKRRQFESLQFSAIIQICVIFKPIRMDSSTAE